MYTTLQGGKKTLKIWKSKNEQLPGVTNYIKVKYHWDKKVGHIILTNLVSSMVQTTGWCSENLIVDDMKMFQNATILLSRLIVRWNCRKLNLFDAKKQNKTKTNEWILKMEIRLN